LPDVLGNPNVILRLKIWFYH